MKRQITHENDRSVDRCLTPEEDSVGDPEQTDDEVDDMLPADLWF